MEYRRGARVYAGRHEFATTAAAVPDRAHRSAGKDQAVSPSSMYADAVPGRPVDRIVSRTGWAGEAERSLGGFRQDVEAAVPALRRYARALTRDAETAD